MIARGQALGETPDRAHAASGGWRNSFMETAGSAFKRGKIVQAAGDVLALGFLALFFCSWVVALGAVSFVLFFEKFGAFVAAGAASIIIVLLVLT